MGLVRISPGEDRIRDIYGNVIGNARIIVDYHESSVDRQAALLRVSDYTSGEGDYIELVTSNDGTFTFEEDNDFSLGSNNLSTAYNLRDAIDGILHLSAKVPSPHTWHPHVSIQYDNGHITSVETRQNDNSTTPSSAWSFRNPNPQITEEEAPIAAIFLDSDGGHAAQPQFSNSNGLYEFYVDNRADISFFFSHPSASFTAESIEDVTLSGVGDGRVEDTRTDISEDGSFLVEDVSNINFSSNVIVDDDGGGQVTVSAIDTDTDTRTSVSDNGTLEVANVTDINFDSGAVVADDGDGSVTIDIVGTSNGTAIDTRTDISEDDFDIVSNVTDINFSNAVTVTDDGDGSVTIDVEESEISLANLGSRSHADLSDAPVNAHIDDLTDIPTRNHNDLNNISEGDHRTQEQIEDMVNGLLVSGTNVTLDYDDVANTLTINASGSATDTHTDVSDDTTTVVSNVSDINFGSLLSATDDGDGSVTIEGIDTTRSDEEIEDVVNTLLAAGDKLSWTYDDINDTLTVDTTALDEEEVEDVINGLIIDGNAIITTYDDGANTFTVAVNEAAISHDNISGISEDDHHVAHEQPGDKPATSDITDNQANTLWDYANQYIPDSVIQQSSLDADTLDSIQLADIDWSDVAMTQTDVVASDVGLENVLNKAQLAKDGSENLIGDLSDDQGNTIYDYSAQEIALTVIQNVLSHSDLTDAPVNAHIDALTDIPTRNHNDTQNISSDDHHTKTIDTRANISDSGTQVLTDVTDINFATNVSVTNDGDGSVTIDSVSDTDTRTDVSDDGTTVVSEITDINFATNVTVTDDGDGSVTIDVTGGSDTRTDVSEDGTIVVSEVTDINFSNAVTVTDDGDGSVTMNVDESGISLANLGSKLHSDLSNAPSSAHHSRYEDSEAETAINNDGDHGSTASHNYNTLVASDVTKSDVDLGNVPNTDIAYSSAIAADDFSQTEVDNLKDGKLDNGNEPWTDNNYYDDGDASAAVSASDVGLGNVEDIALSSAGWGDIGIATTDVTKSDVGLGSVPNTDIAYASAIAADDFTSTEVTSLKADTLADGSSPWINNNYYDDSDAIGATDGIIDSDTVDGKHASELGGVSNPMTEDLDAGGNSISNIPFFSDNDGDTRVAVEENTDEDIVRIYANGTEIINIDDT